MRVKCKRDKYVDLGNYLRTSSKETIELGFKQIEKIINYQLPESAYNESYSWWENDKTHSQAIPWLNAGCNVSVDFNKQTAVFKQKR